MRFIRIVWDSVLILTLKSLVLERSRRNLPPTVGACRDWESTSLTFHLQPSEPVVSGEGDQTCGVTASPWRQDGGERTLCSFLCGNSKTTAEWTRPRNPVTSSREPAEKRRNHHDMIQKKRGERKGNDCTMRMKTHVSEDRCETAWCMSEQQGYAQKVCPFKKLWLLSARPSHCLFMKKMDTEMLNWSMTTNLLKIPLRINRHVKLGMLMK